MSPLDKYMYFYVMYMYIMKATATHLRNHLFEVLDHVQKGESVTIELKGKTVGQIIPLRKADWREKITIKVRKKKGTIRQTFAPLRDVWENHL